MSGSSLSNQCNKGAQWKMGGEKRRGLPSSYGCCGHAHATRRRGREARGEGTTGRGLSEEGITSPLQARNTLGIVACCCVTAGNYWDVCHKQTGRSAHLCHISVYKDKSLNR